MTFVCNVEVLMRLGIGVKVGMVDIDRASAQKAHFGELVECIVNRRE
jgi:hypothetical protein